MANHYTREQLVAMGMDEAQIKAILNVQKEENKEEQHEVEVPVQKEEAKVVPMVSAHVSAEQKQIEPLKVTTMSDLEKYVHGVVVQFPPFAEGQPFIARVKRPSMLALVKSGKIPNTLLNEATNLFAKGAGSMVGQNATTIDELFEVIEVIVDAALLEPTLSDVRNSGMELSDDQLMAIFTYTQQGVKALEQFRM
ncbi:MAG: hypothetical protein ACI4TD_13300 [Phocaeicola sp.]